MHAHTLIDPFEFFAQTELPDWPNGPSLWDAVSAFDPTRPEPLIKLLTSDNVEISRRGLFIFGELDSRRNWAVVDYALKLRDHPQWMARSSLMDGALSLSRKTRESLSVSDLRVILELIYDANDLIREKVAIFISEIERDRISDAISLEPNHVTRKALEIGFGHLTFDQEDAQSFFDDALLQDRLTAAFMFASLLGAARRGVIERAPIYRGKSDIGEGVCFHIQRRIWSFRRRSGQEVNREEVISYFNGRRDLYQSVICDTAPDK